MISLIITLVILIIVVILGIYGFNVALKSAVDSFINKNEKFTNFHTNKLNQVPELDACKKIDKPLKNNLNSQTGTNIPLNPIYYNNHVGHMHNYENELNNDLKEGCACAYQNELLYDGIWKSIVDKKSHGFLNQNWILTNGNIKNNYVCSDKFIQLNKTLPNDFVENDTPIRKPLDTELYFNDQKDDPLDLGINCFPDEFNKGIINCK